MSVSVSLALDHTCSDAVNFAAGAGPLVATSVKLLARKLLVPRLRSFISSGCAITADIPIVRRTPKMLYHLSVIFFFSFYIYTLNLTVQDIKNTKYINDTARSMLYHINPAAYTYKGSFTLYATPQKGREGGREGGAFEFRCSYCETHMGARQRKNVKGKKGRKR